MKPGPQFDQKPLFHGARQLFDDTHVRPPSVTGAYPASSLGFSSGSDRPPHTDLAFATGSESTAWSYARAVPLGANAPINNDPDPKYRSRVLTVGHAPDEHGDLGEIESQHGFPITGVHHSEVGATSTFHELNWNAFKAKPSGPHRLVSSGDKNQSYMENDPNLPAPATHQFKEAALPGRQHRNATDDRHPDQLNLFTGKTVAEHLQYEDTPGVSMHLHPGQFDSAAFHHDPTASVIRASKPYHRVDEEFGTVR